MFVLWGGVDYGGDYVVDIFATREAAERAGADLSGTTRVERRPLWPF